MMKAEHENDIEALNHAEMSYSHDLPQSLSFMYRLILSRGTQGGFTARDIQLAQRYLDLKMQRTTFDDQVAALMEAVLLKTAKHNYGKANARDRFTDVVKELNSYMYTPPGDVFPSGGFMYQQVLHDFKTTIQQVQRGGVNNMVKKKSMSAPKK